MVCHLRGLKAWMKPTFYQPVSFPAWTDFSQTESRDVILKMCWGNCFIPSSVKNYTIALWPQTRSHLKDKTLWFTGGGGGGVRFLWPALFCLFLFFLPQASSWSISCETMRLCQVFCWGTPPSPNTASSRSRRPASTWRRWGGILHMLSLTPVSPTWIRAAGGILL